MPMTAVTATFGMSEFSTVESVDHVMASAFLEIVGEATAWKSSGMTHDFGFSTPLGAVPSSSGWCKTRPQSRLPSSRTATEAATVMAAGGQNDDFRLEGLSGNGTLTGCMVPRTRKSAGGRPRRRAFNSCAGEMSQLLTQLAECITTQLWSQWC